jgi:hypothetical protein
MAFKGFKKTDQMASVDHFNEVAKTANKNTPGTFGRPTIDEYKKQDKRVQFYISQEMIDTLLPIAIPNGCKDVTALAKKLLIDEFEKVSKVK